MLAADAEQGFLLLTDLGDRPVPAGAAARRAAREQADRLMRDALTALVHWQQHVGARGLPPYDEALLRRELALFPHWCVQREFGITWNDAQQQTWDRSATSSSPARWHSRKWPCTATGCRAT